MLTMLFLLFSLGTSMSVLNSTGYDDTEMMATSRRVNIYNNLLVNKIEGKEEVAYRYWDSIPVISPINVRDIKNITSDYGYRTHPIFRTWSKHDGIDFSAKIDTEVLSTANGVVTKVKYSKRGDGNEVTVSHGQDYSTRYAHLDSIHVNEGDRIVVKTSIGTIGSTGLSTGPHLHYEVLKANIPIDPLYFTYKDKSDRTIGKYFSTLIALEKI